MLIKARQVKIMKTIMLLKLAFSSTLTHPLLELLQMEWSRTSAVEKECLKLNVHFTYVREGLPEDDDPGNFCMTKIDGEWSLKRDHSYFFQVQTQLQVCRLSYADFVLWTETGTIIERIYVDPSFWEGLIAFL